MRDAGRLFRSRRVYLLQWCEVVKLSKQREHLFAADVPGYPVSNICTINWQTVECGLGQPIEFLLADATRCAVQSGNLGKSDATQHRVAEQCAARLGRWKSNERDPQIVARPGEATERTAKCVLGGREAPVIGKSSGQLTVTNSQAPM
ncbi:hypothetical protein NDU88_006036 [Pleurodeles waltl]|uniref:Uncharacterized protein n=1 Tax=Pleurodeles waltl TaxID=8319 RepID=A0AAV7MCB0_PLEWA|nr:hypothetical protein NDU88_006036 [Pleurodeles waltl]